MILASSLWGHRYRYAHHRPFARCITSSSLRKIERAALVGRLKPHDAVFTPVYITSAPALSSAALLGGSRIYLLLIHHTHMVPRLANEKLSNPPYLPFSPRLPPMLTPQITPHPTPRHNYAHTHIPPTTAPHPPLHPPSQTCPAESSSSALPYPNPLSYPSLYTPV
jgi:hypothetical protein